MADYCTTAELRTQIEKIGTTGAGGDTALGVIITAISRAIDRYYNRPDNWFVADSLASAKYYPGSGKAFQFIDECTEITAVAVKDSATDDESAGYVAWTYGTIGATNSVDVFAARGDPRYPTFGQTPYNLLLCGLNGAYSYFTKSLYGVPTVKVTAKWGYATTVHPLIKQACIALSARAFKQGESAWADSMASPDLSQILYQRENKDIRFLLDSGRFSKPALGR